MKLNFSHFRVVALITPLFSLSCMRASVDPISVASQATTTPVEVSSFEEKKEETVTSPKTSVRRMQVSQEDDDFLPPVTKKSDSGNPKKNSDDSAIDINVPVSQNKLPGPDEANPKTGAPAPVIANPAAKTTIEDIIAQAEKETQTASVTDGAAVSDKSLDPNSSSAVSSTSSTGGSEGEVVPEPPKVVPIPLPRPKNLGVNSDQAKADMTGPGTLKPTVYYFASINEDKSSCSKSKPLKAKGGKVLITVCESTANACGLQGSCAVTQKGKSRTFNIVGSEGGEDRYFEVDEDGCRYGYGVRSSCLDPFYTLAADLSLYKPGEVIFVPKIVGMVLPDGSKHSGYFVIRDRGNGIKGTGRFDFFSGGMHWRDGDNPFTKIGLGDVNTNIPYYRVGGKTAQQVLQNRSYPELPANAINAD